MPDAPDIEPEAVEGEVAPSGGLKSKLPLIAAIVVGLAVGAGSGAVVLGPLIASKMGLTQAPVPGDSTKADGEGDEGEGKDGKGADGEGQAPTPPVVLLENLVLNPASSGGSRYLLMSIAVECADVKAVTGLIARDAELRDLILATLGRKNVDQLSDVGGREAIKVELMAAIQARFGKSAVKQLYFPQFVIQ